MMNLIESRSMIGNLMSRMHSTNVSNILYHEMQKEIQNQDSKQALKMQRLFIKELEKEEQDRLNQFLKATDDQENEEQQQRRENEWQNESAFQFEKKLEENDPYMRYGVGISNYFAMQSGLIKLFFFLSVLASIQMLIYASFNGLDYLPKVNTLAHISFGNIGFSDNDCGKSLIMWDEFESTTLNFACQGSTQISGIASSGIINAGFYKPGETDQYQKFEFENDCFIKSEDAAVLPQMINFDQTQIDEFILASCKG